MVCAADGFVEERVIGKAAKTRGKAGEVESLCGNRIRMLSDEIDSYADDLGLRRLIKSNDNTK